MKPNNSGDAAEKCLSGDVAPLSARRLRTPQFGICIESADEDITTGKSTSKREFRKRSLRVPAARFSKQQHKNSQQEAIRDISFETLGSEPLAREVVDPLPPITKLNKPETRDELDDAVIYDAAFSHKAEPSHCRLPSFADGIVLGFPDEFRDNSRVAHVPGVPTPLVEKSMHYFPCLWPAAADHYAELFTETQPLSADLLLAHPTHSSSSGTRKTCPKATTHVKLEPPVWAVRHLLSRNALRPRGFVSRPRDAARTHRRSGVLSLASRLHSDAFLVTKNAERFMTEELQAAKRRNQT